LISEVLPISPQLAPNLEAFEVVFHTEPQGPKVNLLKLLGLKKLFEDPQALFMLEVELTDCLI
jgi:hypothetical protein